MTDTPVEDWFPGWLTGHLLRHARASLPTPESEEGRLVYPSWIRLFKQRGIDDPDVAAEASERLLADPPPPRMHLAKLLEAAKEIARAHAERESSGSHQPAFGLVRASELSAGCPECHGTGWATRKARWHSMARVFLLDLFCRCPAGRWRKANDPELSRGERMRQHDDLQARPELWDASLSFKHWSGRPCGHDLMTEGCEGEGREWWYEPVDQEARVS